MEPGKQQDGIVSTDRSPSIAEMMQDALRHHREGQFAAAERLYRRILAGNPRHADALHLLGMIEYQAGRLEPAAALICKAIALNSKGASYYANLGTVLQAQGKMDEAKALYNHALTLKPDLAEVQVNLANVLQAQGELDEGIAWYERALALNPDSAEAHNNLGNALQTQEKIEDAIACYRRALLIKPDYTQVYFNLGNASRAQNKLDEAVDYYHQALALEPDYAEAHYNLGNVLRAQNKLDEALAEFARALAIRPDYAQAGFGQALAQLLHGGFAVGWKNYERRWNTRDHDTPQRAYPQPLWTGEKLASGSLLIWGEQGVGDEVMFAGLLPDVARTGNRCVLDCDPRLNTLFARSFPSIHVVSGCGPGLHPELDIVSHMPSGSLPGLFRTAIPDFAATTSPYLVADPRQSEQLRARYADGRRRIGVAWYTNNCKTGRERSIDLSLFAAVCALPDHQWVSLQYGGHNALEQQVAAAGLPILVDHAVDQLSDIDLFAAQIAAMDLVVTIDNSTAHLAGALGVPVWVLLPFAPDWRWLMEREDCPWYPTMRLFRQPALGDWQSVMDSVQKAMANAF